jgi:hypothetical protein
MTGSAAIPPYQNQITGRATLAPPNLPVDLFQIIHVWDFDLFPGVTYVLFGFMKLQLN